MRISDWSSDVCSSDLKNLDGRLPHGERTDADHELLTLVTQAVATEFPATMQDFALSQAIDIWLRAVFACNAYIDTQAPWTLRKTDPQRMQAVLSTLYEAHGPLAIAIQSINTSSTAPPLYQMRIHHHHPNFQPI